MSSRWPTPSSEQVLELAGAALGVGLGRLSVEDDGLRLEEGQEAITTTFPPDP